jgi:predicted transcriptional regulator of viral defense system
MKRDDLLELLKAEKTIFTFKDVSLLWGETDRNFAKKKIYRYVKAGKLFSVRKGIYSKEITYDKYELATKIYTPAYISFETVLGMAGVTFQFYGQIFIASYLTREMECNGQKYSFCRIKEEVLTNPHGLEVRKNYCMASLERAFLDVIYRHKDYHFDNLAPLNWDKVNELLPIYGGNKRMAQAVKKYHLAFMKNLK